MALLVFQVELLHISPIVAFWPAMIVGSLIQFLGNKRYAFQVKTNHRLPQELIYFAISEIISWGLNWVGFYLLVTRMGVNYVLGRGVVSAVVYCGVSYPLWKWIFRGAADDSEMGSGTN